MNISVKLFSAVFAGLVFFLLQTYPKPVRAINGCFCNDSVRCYSDGCTRKTWQGDHLEWEAGCNVDFCGGHAYNMCYDSNSIDVNRYFCTVQPPSCFDTLMLFRAGNAEYAKGSCWPELGYCHPYFCGQMNNPSGCGHYWKWHSNIPDWMNREYGYGCVKGTGPENLQPVYGLPAGVPGSATYTPVPTSTVAVPTHTPIPSSQPTNTPFHTITPTITPSIPQVTSVPSSTPTSAAPTLVPTTGPAVLPKIPPDPYPVIVCKNPVSCPSFENGDSNCDGEINIQDLYIWHTQLGSIPDPDGLNANFNCVEGNRETHFVDLVDYEIWRRGINSVPISTPSSTKTPDLPTNTPSATAAPSATVTPVPNTPTATRAPSPTRSPSSTPVIVQPTTPSCWNCPGPNCDKCGCSGSWCNQGGCEEFCRTRPGDCNRC